MSSRKNLKIKTSKSDATASQSDIKTVVSQPETDIQRTDSVSSDLSSGNDDANSDKKSRVIVTRDIVMSSFDEIIQLIEGEIDSLKDSPSKTKGIKFLRSLNKKIKTLKNNSGKIIKQKSTKKTTPNVNSGFQKPVRISKEMAKFAGWNCEELKSRVDVTKYLCNYIKENNLQNPKDKRQIVSDAKLSKLLKYDAKKEPLTYFRLQSCLKSHFPKTDAVVEAV